MGGLVSILKSAVSYNFCTGAPISLHLLLLGAFLAQSLNSVINVKVLEDCENLMDHRLKLYLGPRHLGLGQTPGRGPRLRRQGEAPPWRPVLELTILLLDNN